MRQIQGIDNDISELGMTHDDSTMGANGGGSGGGGGMSIGNTAPIQNLDKHSQEPPEEYTPYVPEQPIFPEPEPKPEPEPRTTQGENEKMLQDYKRRIEEIGTIKPDLEKLIKDIKPNWNLGQSKKSIEDLFRKYDITEAQYKIGQQADYYKNVFQNALDKINKEESELYNNIYNIQTSKDYDPRTVEEQRQDTATQRAAQDYVKAGLNPKALSGFTGGGGGGGGGNSKDDEEEKKRKRRREELENIRRAKEAERMRQRELITGIVQSLTNTATKAVGGAAFMGHQKAMQATNQSHDLIKQDTQHLHEHDIEAIRNKRYKNR